MTQQTQAANSNASSDADKKDALYNIGGVLSGIEYRTNTNGTPYFYGKLDTVLKGRKTKITVMGFGKALDNVRPAWSRAPRCASTATSAAAARAASRSASSNSAARPRTKPSRSSRPPEQPNTRRTGKGTRRQGAPPFLLKGIRPQGGTQG